MKLIIDIPQEIFDHLKETPKYGRGYNVINDSVFEAIENAEILGNDGNIIPIPAKIFNNMTTRDKSLLLLSLRKQECCEIVVYGYKDK